MITLTFKYTNHNLEYIYDVNLEEIIGNFINNIINRSQNFNIYAFEVKNKWFGYDFLLLNKFKHYVEFTYNKQLTVNCHNIYNVNAYTKNISYPLIYYRNLIIWPPCNNLNDEDPINLDKFLSLTNTLNIAENNSYENLIIIKYNDNNSIKEVKKVVNKYSYFNAVSLNYKDPLTGKQLDMTSIYFLKNSVYYKQSLTRPLLEIPLVFKN